MITITVNGKERSIEKEMGLLEYLEAQEINPRLIAIEYNGEILRREQFGEIVLRQDDTLEIVHMIGGG